MKLSKKFLNDYIDIKDIDYNEVAEKMVSVGNEYESVNALVTASNVVVGYVKEMIMHPESTKLHICTVDYGNGDTQIICGAPNVDKGQKVIVAKPGAIVAGGMEIKQAKLAGYESNGMICSLSELGIESKYQSEEDKTGIHILPDDAPIGEDAIKYLGLDDEVIDFELTANRGDLLSVIGMAYEVGAIFSKKVTLPETNVNSLKVDINDTHTLKVETDNCPMYLARKVNNVEITESPDFIKNRLIASGIRPINNVVDISNYVMLEYGQPLHFFDSDKLGNDIIVRMAASDEELTTLDGINRKLSDTDIVITNKKEVVALAGVMGGLSTEVEMDTKNITIEAAIFNPVNVRTTSRKILRSESSNRFEKGIDPNRVEEALNRACYLLSIYASGEVESGVLTHDKENHNKKEIEISISDINNKLGTTLTNKQIEDVFERLAFEFNKDKDNYKVIVPTRRGDISIKEDLTEEVGRIIGYDNVVGVLPILEVKKGVVSSNIEYKKTIRNYLCSLGLNQVVNYSLIKESDFNTYSSNINRPIKLIDPLSEDKVVLRQDLINSLITNCEYNTSRNLKDINIFEISNVYYNDNDEEIKLACLLSGNYITNTWQNNTIKTDFYVVKGILESLLNYLGFKNRYTYNTDTSEFLHPTRSANIVLDNEIIGVIGQINPIINKDEIYVLEISVSKLLDKKIKPIKYKEPSKYPTVTKDLAFVVDKNITSKQILDVLTKTGGRLIYNIDVFDLYTGDKLDETKKSIAYTITFGDPNKTLTEEEVMDIFNKMINDVESKLDAKVRNN